MSLYGRSDLDPRSGNDLIVKILPVFFTHNPLLFPLSVILRLIHFLPLSLLLSTLQLQSTLSFSLRIIDFSADVMLLYLSFSCRPFPKVLLPDSAILSTETEFTMKQTPAYPLDCTKIFKRQG